MDKKEIIERMGEVLNRIKNNSRIVKESELQAMETIELSYTGELIPLEEVEGIIHEELETLRGIREDRNICVNCGKVLLYEIECNKKKLWGLCKECFIRGYIPHPPYNKFLIKNIPMSENDDTPQSKVDEGTSKRTLDKESG